jgi:hypothetical protein
MEGGGWQREGRRRLVLLVPKLSGVARSSSSQSLQGFNQLDERWFEYYVIVYIHLKILMKLFRGSSCVQLVPGLVWPSHSGALGRVRMPWQSRHRPCTLSPHVYKWNGLQKWKRINKWKNIVEWNRVNEWNRI